MSLRHPVVSQSVIFIDRLYVSHFMGLISFFDGYCSTVQGLLDWFEVDLGFTELS